MFYVDEKFEPGTIVHIRARLALLTDPQMIDEDGIIYEEDAIKVSPWSRQRSTVYIDDFGNYNNYNYSEQKPDNQNDGDYKQSNYNASNDNSIDSARDIPNGAWRDHRKLKIRCNINLDEKVFKKAWTLYNHEKKQDFDVDMVYWLRK